MENKQYGLRYNEGKPRFDLIDPTAMRMLAEVLTYGANKYAAHNWRTGLPYSNCIASLGRHFQAFMAGEDKDPESGLPHIGHILCNAMFLGYFSVHRTDLDDRWRPSDTGVDGDLPDSTSQEHLRFEQVINQFHAKAMLMEALENDE